MTYWFHVSWSWLAWLVELEYSILNTEGLQCSPSESVTADNTQSCEYSLTQSIRPPQTFRDSISVSIPNDAFLNIIGYYVYFLQLLRLVPFVTKRFGPSTTNYMRTHSSCWTTLSAPLSLSNRHPILPFPYQRISVFLLGSPTPNGLIKDEESNIVSVASRFVTSIFPSCHSSDLIPAHSSWKPPLTSKLLESSITLLLTLDASSSGCEPKLSMCVDLCSLHVNN